MQLEEQPFATIEDLQLRWRPLLESEKPKAEVLLMDASDQLRTLFPDLTKRIEKGKTKLGLVKSVVCAMVRRAMNEVDQPYGGGVSQFSQSAGPFSESYHFSNPDGDMFIRKSEREKLGYSGQFIASIDLGGILKGRRSKDAA
jgi:hypothetical protein